MIRVPAKVEFYLVEGADVEGGAVSPPSSAAGRSRLISAWTDSRRCGCSSRRLPAVASLAITSSNVGDGPCGRGVRGLSGGIGEGQGGVGSGITFSSGRGAECDGRGGGGCDWRRDWAGSSFLR